MKTGPRNLITDVAGLSVGHAHDEKLASGVTVVLAESAAVTAASIFGGGPGTRELDAVNLEGSVGVADAIVLSGGSAFGLDAASGVQAYLREAERGFSVGPVRIPIVPQAILFDLTNGGDKVWGAARPIRSWAFWPPPQPRRISRSVRQERGLARPYRLAKACASAAVSAAHPRRFLASPALTAQMSWSGRFQP